MHFDVAVAATAHTLEPHAVVKDGRMLFAKGYGVRQLGDTAPVDAFTCFQIASNTKAFTMRTSRPCHGHCGLLEYGFPNTAARASRASSVRTTTSSESPSASTREKSR
jgi:hypothetical protein